jgi:hypothetical protein
MLIARASMRLSPFFNPSFSIAGFIIQIYNFTYNNNTLKRIRNDQHHHYRVRAAAYEQALP